MKNRKEEVYDFLLEKNKPLSAKELSEELSLDRTNVSRYLNELVKELRIGKLDGRPVKFHAKKQKKIINKYVTFDNLIGKDDSLRSEIQKAKAAILYPPHGLHTIIFGQTGTGKTMFAECMYRFAVSSKTLDESAPFITFNCADYAQNPQLLYAHIFGVKKGAYTGADSDRSGLLEQADGGILFLDEIHRLPPEGQEMLFTFIDKGIYRALGDSMEKSAVVQIIGATTESSDMLLSTFNRRIPMQIDLPALEHRSMDERLSIIKEFLQQESNRLQQEITIDKKSLLAFLLYKADGNIGQLKRDLKLVCAKAFLHHQTNESSDKLRITDSDLPIIVQKGLLRQKDFSDDMGVLFDKKNLHLSLKPGTQEVLWEEDPTKDMEIYQSISHKLDQLGKENLSEIDLEKLISNDVEMYFENYVEELSHTNIYKEIISDDLWRLTNKLYDFASNKLSRYYDEKVRFAFALHISSTIKRLKDGQFIEHPDLNTVRREHIKEFQLAIEFSGEIESLYEIEIPLDEIGFVTMFLTMDTQESVFNDNNQVEVLVVMHGQSTASSMLETAQELLGTDTGTAFNMPLTTSTEGMYSLIKTEIENKNKDYSEGIILLTDMGSPNNFGDLISNELGIRTKVISMTSTLIVLECLRLAMIGRSLEEIHNSVLVMFKNMISVDSSVSNNNLNKVIVVACFTGEGVAKELSETVSLIVDTNEYEIIQLQLLERKSFKKKIDQLICDNQIVAIIGTIDMDYQDILFIPAVNLFRIKKIKEFQKILIDNYFLPDILDSMILDFSLNIDINNLMNGLINSVYSMYQELDFIIEMTVLQALCIHLIVLSIKKMEGKNETTYFEDINQYCEENKLLYDICKKSLKGMENSYSLKYTKEDIAYILEIFKNNKKELSLHTV